jgi:subtilisin-like proprotein convertase family protein
LTLVPAASAAPPENTSPISIGDCCAPQPATPYGRSITVSGMAGSITKVTATLTGVTHGASSDLDILLVAPTNQSVLLLSDTGISASGANLVFDDTGATPINAIPLASGTYTPTNNAEDCPGAGDTFPAPAPGGAPGGTLSTLNGLAPNGIWNVYVLDDCEVDSGSVSGISLTITSTGSPATPFAAAGGVTIPDCCPATAAGLYPSPIVVSGTLGTITGLSVTLTNLTHGYVADLNALLVGPGGEKVLLTSDAGRAASNATLVFNDAAGAPVPAAGPVPSGTYTPTNNVEECATGSASDSFPSPAPSGPYGTSLSVFNGTSANGTWSLYVADDCTANTGQIQGGWALTFAGPTSVTVSAFSAKRTAKGVALGWRTGQETSLLGFNVLRSSSGRTYAKVNKYIVRAKGKARGATYGYLDKTAKKGRAYTYRLQSVGIDGKKKIRATFKVKAR